MPALCQHNDPPCALLELAFAPLNSEAGLLLALCALGWPSMTCIPPAFTRERTAWSIVMSRTWRLHAEAQAPQPNPIPHVPSSCPWAMLSE